MSPKAINALLVMHISVAGTARTLGANMAALHPWVMISSLQASKTKKAKMHGVAIVRFCTVLAC